MNAVTINVTPLVGDPVTMHLKPLTTRVYHEVVFNAFTTLLSGFGTSGNKVRVDIGSALRALDFDKFERIASALLNGGVVEGVGVIASVFDHDFFRQRTDVLYIATLEALKRQCPDLFLALSARFDSNRRADPESGE